MKLVHPVAGLQPHHPLITRLAVWGVGVLLASITCRTVSVWASKAGQGDAGGHRRVRSDGGLWFLRRFQRPRVGRAHQSASVTRAPPCAFSMDKATLKLQS